MTEELSNRIEEVQAAMDAGRAELSGEVEEVRNEVLSIREQMGAITAALDSLKDAIKDLHRNGGSPQRHMEDVKEEEPIVKASSRPKKRLEPINYTPEDKPAEYRVWLERASEYQDYYGLSDDEAVKDLLWASNAIVKFRIKAERRSNPRMTFKELCGALLKRSMPHDMEIVQYRKLHKVEQLEGESGESYVRRFELSMAEYLWYAPDHSPADLYKTFIAKMNTKYTDRMREATSSIGLLGRIVDPGERLKQAFSLMRSISITQTGERSFGDLHRALENRKKRVSVNTVVAEQARVSVNEVRATSTKASVPNQQLQSTEKQDWRCRPCKTDEHEWTGCEAGLANAYCYRCKKRGHPTFMHRASTEGSGGADGPPGDGNVTNK